MPNVPDPLKAPTPRPCSSCPYRRDVPSAVWAPAEYTKLIAYDRPTPEQPQKPFLCHQTVEDDPTPPHLCGGWVACHGDELLALRIAAMDDRLVGEELQKTMNYSSPVPLFATGTDAAVHGMRDARPSARAAAIAAKVVRRRPAIANARTNTTEQAPRP